jgi:predicted Zn-ribbon and HTH transcriptional regulator
MEVSIPTVNCLRCGHKWNPRIANPRVCARCHSPWWDTPRPSIEKRSVRIEHHDEYIAPLPPPGVQQPAYREQAPRPQEPVARVIPRTLPPDFQQREYIPQGQQPPREVRQPAPRQPQPSPREQAPQYFPPQEQEYDSRQPQYPPQPPQYAPQQPQYPQQPPQYPPPLPPYSPQQQYPPQQNGQYDNGGIQQGREAINTMLDDYGNPAQTSIRPEELMPYPVRRCKKCGFVGYSKQMEKHKCIQ